MKKECEVEKWFRAKGTDKYFKTGTEAAEYAKTVFAKDLLQQIKYAYKFKDNCTKKMKQIKMLVDESKSKTLNLREVWKVRGLCENKLLYSEKSNVSMKLFFDVNMESKKGLNLLRELVKYYGKEQIKMYEKQIRSYKENIKALSRKYDNLREFF